MEVVRLAHGGFSDLVELKRADESTTVLRIVSRMLPRNEYIEETSPGWHKAESIMCEKRRAKIGMV